MTEILIEPRPKAAHLWERDAADFYIEPAWCAERLFAVEKFEGSVIDPACGLGTIVRLLKRPASMLMALTWSIVPTAGMRSLTSLRPPQRSTTSFATRLSSWRVLSLSVRYGSRGARWRCCFQRNGLAVMRGRGGSRPRRYAVLCSCVRARQCCPGI
jgi:hypothetical protein